MKTEQPIKVMNKEQQQIIDEVYERYWSSIETSEYDGIGPTSIKLPTLMKEEFINKCKTDPEFSEKWGLKIYTKVDGDKVWMGLVYNDNAVEIRLK